MEKAVVTGGAGFIGSHLAHALSERGYSVTVLDNLSTGKKENIADLISCGSVDFVEGDITDLDRVQRTFRGATYVFHEAALARVPRSIEAPIPTNEANINGTLNVLLAARDNQVKKVVYASSSSVYGGTPTLPQNETMPPSPLSPYALTKLTGEYYCEIFRSLYGLSTASLRYFNVYGPRQDPFSQYATAVAAFLGRLAQDLPPIIHGDGEQTRDMTYVGDVVQANILAAENGAEGIYNIGSGTSVTINQLARLLLDITGKNLVPIHEAPRIGEPRQTLADITKAKTFGYQPRYDLTAGLREVVEEFYRARA